jgi:hypothetical protein
VNDSQNTWKIRPDREEKHYDNIYSITLDSEYEGWTTDSGTPGYGLPKELAQWICDKLNEHKDECPYHMKWGMWVKNGME